MRASLRSGLLVLRAGLAVAGMSAAQEGLTKREITIVVKNVGGVAERSFSWEARAR